MSRYLENAKACSDAVQAEQARRLYAERMKDADTLVTDDEARTVREIVQRQDALNDPYAWHKGIEEFLRGRARSSIPVRDPLERLIVKNPDVLLANLRGAIREDAEMWQAQAERDKVSGGAEGYYSKIILMLLAERQVLLACERENEELVLDRDCRRLEAHVAPTKGAGNE